MTANEIYRTVSYYSDITLDEQPYEVEYITRCIRSGMNDVLALHLSTGNLDAGKIVYTQHSFTLGDGLSFPTGDWGFVFEPRSPRDSSFPLFFHYFRLRVEFDEFPSSIVRCKYIGQQQYLNSRRIVRTPLPAGTYACTLFPHSYFYDSTESTYRDRYIVVANVDQSVYSPDPITGVVAEMAYWREPSFNRLRNIVELPDAYHEEIVQAAISYIQKGQYLYPVGMESRIGITEIPDSRIPVVGRSITEQKNAGTVQPDGR